jgi:phosphopantothenoylcysteine decarboxylase/phosphopantothenate--cysteine ligase
LILGVSGGIAAYKACELASRLAKEKARVTAVLTRAGKKFVTPYSFEALTGQPCLTSLFRRIPSVHGSPFPHLQSSQEAEMIILAPATANLIARLAMGLASDLLSTVCLSARCPILVCPAMNSRMWEHPATKRNVDVLSGFGYSFCGPESGMLACGMEGPGRMAEPAMIVDAVCRILDRNGGAPAN